MCCRAWLLEAASCWKCCRINAAQNDSPLSDRERRDFRGPALGTRVQGHLPVVTGSLALHIHLLLRSWTSQLQHDILAASPGLGSTPVGMKHGALQRHINTGNR